MVSDDRRGPPVSRPGRDLPLPALVPGVLRRTRRRVIRARLITALDVVVRRRPSIADPGGLVVRALGAPVLAGRAIRQIDVRRAPGDRGWHRDRVGVVERA